MTLRRITVFILMLACGLALAAEPAKKPPISPIVNIKKADGSTLRGQLVSADGLFLSIRPGEGREFGEPVEVAWIDVKTISNGLTAPKAQATWKAAHTAGEFCEGCNGDHVVICDKCHGTGHDAASSKDCAKCGGKQSLACSNRKCDKGWVPCPAPCLKTTDKWDADGWQTFKFPGGNGIRISKGHVGEIVKFDRKTGTASHLPCETCGATQKVPCPTCKGTAELPCPTCKADKAAADCASCEDGTMICLKCNGSGLKGQPRSGPSEFPSKPKPTAPAVKEEKPAANPGAGDGF